MNVTIQNVGAHVVPVVPGSGSGPHPTGVIATLQPGESASVDDPETSVISIGDNPSFLEELQEGLSALGALLKKALDALREWWGSRNDERAENEPEAFPVAAVITNHGPNSLRVLLGSNVNEVQVDAGVTYTATSERYIEVRELGV